MKIRKAEIKDVKQVAKIMNQVQKLHCENRPDIFRERSIDELEKQVTEAINENEKENVIIVAENDSEEIVGILNYKIRIIEEGSRPNLKPNSILSISELGVEENWRGKGIGKQLMNEAEKIKITLGCERLELNCWSFNEKAMGFYASCGMKIQRVFLEK